MKVVSHLHSQMRGKLAGLVYSSSPWAPIVARQYVVPTNKNTTEQNYSRQAMQQAVNDWTTVDESFRAEWRAWATGAGYTKGGRHGFIRMRSTMLYGVMRGLLDDVGPKGAPNLLWDPTAAISLGGAPGTVGQTGFKIEINNVSPVELTVLYWQSANFHQSRYFWRGPWDTKSMRVEKVAANTAETITVLPVGVSEGDVTFVRLVPLAQLATPYSGNLVGHEIILRGISTTAEA